MRIKWWGKAARKGLVGVAVGDGLSVAVIDRSRGPRPRLAELRWLDRPAGQEDRDLKHDLQGLRLKKARTATLMAPADYQLLLVEAPRVEPSELRAAVRWRIKDLIDYHIDDAVIDVFEIPGQRQNAQGQVMMYAVVAKQSAVRARIEALERGELKLEVIDIPEMALRNIAAQAPEDQAGCVLLQLGERHGLITVTRQQNLFLARRIEVGAAKLREQPNADKPLAADADPYGDPLDMMLDKLIDGIVLEIQRSIDYYDRHYGQPTLAGVLLAPTGPGLAGIESRLKRQLGLPVRRLDLNQMLDCVRPIDEAEQARCLMAIGTALRHEETVL